MKPIRIYFAHPINTYNTIIEKYFIEYVEELGDNIELVNPNQEIHQEGYKEKGMDYFKDLVLSCDKLYAFGFADNSIGAGIAKEMNWMYEKGGAVIFFPFFSKIEEQMTKSAENQFNVLSVEETRNKLKSYIL